MAKTMSFEIMSCKHCGNKIPLGSVYCMYCGCSLIKKKTDKKEIKIPEPKQLPSGSWFVRLRYDGQDIPVTRDTYADCKAEAQAIKAGLIESKKNPHITLKQACEKYIEKRNSVLSETTISGYECIIRTRFKNYMSKDINGIDWQKMVDEESTLCSGKTLENAWGFIACVLKENEITFSKPTLSEYTQNETAWLDYEQLEVFLKAIKGDDCEFGALLGLHGLRRSEIFAITPNKIEYNSRLKQYEINVEGARVRGRDNKVIDKVTNKNKFSTRKVPVMIPRLEELIKASSCGPDEKYVDRNLNYIYKRVNSICKKNNLPLIGTHGMRRTFASLCHHLNIPELETMKFGGWNDFKTMHDFYIKLSTKDQEKATKKIRKFYIAKTG